MTTDELLRLVDQAGFVFRGTAVRPGADAEIGPAAAGHTITVEVEEVLRGTDVLRGLVGRNVIVVSDDPADIEPAARHVFFTNCVSLGDTVVAREVGRRGASHESLNEIAESLRVTADLPLAARLVAADLIVTGEITSSARVNGPRLPRSEHDPDWWIARVAVELTIKGRSPRKRVDVLFANSLDIAWYRSPKLHEGVSGIFLLHSRTEDAALREVPRTVYQATDPLDFLPIGQLPQVQRMLDNDSGERSDA